MPALRECAAARGAPPLYVLTPSRRNLALSDTIITIAAAASHLLAARCVRVVESKACWQVGRAVRPVQPPIVQQGEPRALRRIRLCRREHAVEEIPAEDKQLVGVRERRHGPCGPARRQPRSDFRLAEHHCRPAEVVQVEDR